MLLWIIIFTLITVIVAAVCGLLACMAIDVHNMWEHYDEIEAEKKRVNKAYKQSYLERKGEL